MSLENAILDPKWHPLFTDQERKTARQRLEKLNYKPTW